MQTFQVPKEQVTNLGKELSKRSKNVTTKKFWDVRVREMKYIGGGGYSFKGKYLLSTLSSSYWSEGIPHIV